MIINYTVKYDSDLSGGLYQTHGDKESFIGMLNDIAINFKQIPMLTGVVKRNGITVLSFDYDGFKSKLFANAQERSAVGIPMHEFWQYYRDQEVKRFIDAQIDY